MQHQEPNDGTIAVPIARIAALDASYGAALAAYADGRDQRAAVIILTAVGDLLDAIAAAVGDDSPPWSRTTPPQVHDEEARTRSAEISAERSNPLAVAIGIVNAVLLTASAVCVVLLILAAAGVLC